MKKLIKSISAITLAALLLTACGTGDGNEQLEKSNGSDSQQGTEGPVDNEQDEMVEKITSEQVSAELVNSNGNYTFTLKNVTDKEIKLAIGAQEYEYQILDSKGEVLYTYSMDKVFMAILNQVTLAPGEELTYSVDVSHFSNLESGTYTLKIWSVASEADGIEDEMEFTIEEAASNVSGKYVGAIDNNSVEISDENGNANAYRLPELLKEMVEALSSDAKVTYSYFKQNGQNVLTAIEVVQ